MYNLNRISKTIFKGGVKPLKKTKKKDILKPNYVWFKTPNFENFIKDREYI